jgi:hypothetical protein
MNCRVVVAKFLESAAVAGLTELPAIEGKTAERVARNFSNWLWLLKLLHRNWTWLRVHEFWLPEIRANLVQHRGCDAHHSFFLLNSRDIFLGFWAPFGAMSSSMILTIEVRVSWVVIRESQRSSSSSPSPWCEPSSRAWSTILVRLRIFHVVDVSWILRLWSPRHLFVALSSFISFSHSSALIIIGQDVFFEFKKKFINCLWRLSCQVRSCWSWSQALDQCFDSCFVIRLKNLGSLLHEPSHEVP